MLRFTVKRRVGSVNSLDVCFPAVTSKHVHCRRTDIGRGEFEQEDSGHGIMPTQSPWFEKVPMLPSKAIGVRSRLTPVALLYEKMATAHFVRRHGPANRVRGERSVCSGFPVQNSPL